MFLLEFALLYTTFLRKNRLSSVTLPTVEQISNDAMDCSCPNIVLPLLLEVIERIVVDSDLLRNRLGDPTEREVIVHIPKQGLEMIQSR